MKTRIFTVLFLVVTVVLSTSEASGQFVWTKDSHNPVFSGGGTGAWDNDVNVPWVIFNSDSARYEMWYTGPPTSRGYIGFAISSDGITWKRELNPVLSPSPGTWDSLQVCCSCVLRENGQYKMWYTGTATNSSGTAVGTRIGYATSPDGRNWTKYAGNPVFTAGPSTWEAGAVAYCSVIKSAGGYVMFYNGCIADANLNRIGRATSVDGITWQRDTLHNPVLNIGGTGAWDGNIYLPRVLDLGGKYYLWYTAETVPGDNYPRIGLATSADSGKTWVKYAQNPVLTMGSSGSWDERWVELGSVFFKNSFHMWYDGGAPPAYLGRVGHATSPVAAGIVRRVPAQYPTIQAAINAATLGDTVLVSDGTYYENIRFKGKRIVVGSTYLTTSDTSHISKTIIDGSHSTNPDSSSVVYFIDGEDTTSVLCGFTITGGKGTHLSKWNDLEGGGVLCFESGGRLTRNIITGNTLLDNLDRYFLFGAGVAADTSGGQLLIMENNIVTGNTARTTTQSVGGVGIAIYAMNAILRQNVITDNSGVSQSTSSGWSSGGGIFCENGTMSIDGNLIARNKALAPNISGPLTPCGGGVFAEAVNLDFRNNRVIDNVAQSSPSVSALGGGIIVFAETPSELRSVVVTGNYFASNTVLGGLNSSGGGIYVLSENPLIENNMIVKNSASQGGGVGIDKSIMASGSPTLINNTIAFNRATSGPGAGIYSQGISTPIVINTIAWGDTGDQEIAAVLGNTTVRVLYSDIQGGWPLDPSNINVDPKFLDTTYRLSDFSNCIGKGTDSAQISISSVWYRAPRTDFYGSLRPNPAGTKPDIGACENPRGTPTGVDEQPNSLPISYALEQNYPNPFNPSTTIRYGLPQRSHVLLTVFNTLGQQVAVLQNQEQEAGYHDIRFEGRNLASGVYFYRMQAGNSVQTRRFILLR